MSSNTHADNQTLVTVDEVAKRLSLSRSSIYILIRKGLLNPIKIGRCSRIRLQDVDQYVQTLFGPTQGVN